MTADNHVVDAMLTPGNTHDVSVAEYLLCDVFGCAVLADAGYDSNKLRQALRSQNNDPHIPGRKNRKQPVKCDPFLYRYRKFIEIKFGILKENKRIDTRFDKSDTSYLSFIALGCIKHLLNIIIS